MNKQCLIILLICILFTQTGCSLLKLPFLVAQVPLKAAVQLVKIAQRIPLPAPALLGL